MGRVPGGDSLEGNPSWFVWLLEEAENELNALARRNQKLKRAANDEIVVHLKVNPLVFGEPCKSPEGARKAYFWGNRYRMVWLPRPKLGEVAILGVNLRDHRTASSFTAIEGRAAPLVQGGEHD